MIQKESLNINFARGLDQKTDPWQVSPDRFLALENSVFTKSGRLTKRNGFGSLSTISDETVSFLTTYQGNLTAIGTSIYAYNSENASFVNKGSFVPLSLSTLSLVKNNYSQTQCDSANAPNGTVCVVYTETESGSSFYKYSILDGTTGQVLVAPTAITPTSGAVTGSPRVFVLNSYFIIVFTVTITGTEHLQYISISYNSLTENAAVNLSSSYTAADSVAWDGSVLNGSLYLAWNSSASAGILMGYINSSLNFSGATNVDSSHVATIVSVTNDGTNLFTSYYNSGNSHGYVVCVNQDLSTVFSAKQWISSGTVLSLTSACAVTGTVQIYYEVSNDYGYDSIASNYIGNISVSAATTSSASVLKRSVGLASKAFVITNSYAVIYMLTAYESPYQSTYFLVDGSGNIAAQLAYQNGGGYLATGLPQVSVVDDIASIAYLFKDFVSSTATGTTNVSQTPNIYFQTGINQVSFTMVGANVYTSEIGNTLNLTGGFLWTYDGSLAFENGFFLYPDSVEGTAITSGGDIEDQDYFYQAVYEWSDNQGNQYHSAPSIPNKVTMSGGSGSGSITVNVPTLRVSYKTNVKITLYRWSTAQQIYYQTTSITSPTLNDPTIDYVTITDINSDEDIAGNNIIYTAGGVIEDTSAPSGNAINLFDNRLWLVDAENPNLLWYSKQVIQATPVEMSDLFSIYISPTQSAQGSTGPITAIAPMDDKLVIFKRDAIYYINGTGPDNTGANSQYSEPIFVTSTVGSTLPRSIVLSPDGLMFQSDKGIWILDRNLQTTYIGNPVEDYTSSATVNSALNIPATNQVRFTMSSGITLVYNYFYDQWATFSNLRILSSTIYSNAQTLLNASFQILKETDGTYLDGASPVLISFKTAWINVAGLQGYMRSYFFYLLGQWLTPHKIQLYISYDYNPGYVQSTLITPNNYAGIYGGPVVDPSTGTQSDGVYGSDPTYGGSSAQQDELARGAVEQWRVFLSKQRCQSFQITMQEIYDPSYGIAAGGGLTLSGLNLVYGIKKSFRPISAATSTGAR